MYFEENSFHLNPLSAIYTVSQTLKQIDVRLMDHGERVAYTACALCDAGKLDLDEKTLFLLSIFHDIGAYKTDEIDRMLEFETREVWSHAIYGYLFLKHMTPLKDYAQAVLYHHSDWDTLQQVENPIRSYAALIHLADRLDAARACGADSPQVVKQLLARADDIAGPEYAALLRRCCEQPGLFAALADPAVYQAANRTRLLSFDLGAAEALFYLKMVVYSIDFRSEHTVTHSINTISLALDIARHFRLSTTEQNDIYLGALLHDVGKIAIPTEILEFPGRLTDEQMTVMRTHVTQTERLIRNAVPDHVCELAIRHHEKLDGSGYPAHLTAKDLTFAQRIIAVADIISALSSRRSYKMPFPKEKTISILTEMSDHQLDADICAYVCQNYDEIMVRTEPERNAVIERYHALMQEFSQLKQQFDPEQTSAGLLNAFARATF